MCFSPLASFSAVGFLTVVGVAARGFIDRPEKRLLSAIPLFLALQQLMEGIVWLAIGTPDSVIANAASYVFLAFAYLVWPILIPVSIMLAEPNPDRSKYIALVAALGVFLAITFGASATELVVAPRVVDGHLQYIEIEASLYSTILKVSYLAILAVASLLSSLNYMWVLGFLLTLSFGVAEAFGSSVFPSVWCFFSAIVSTSIYFILRYNWGELSSRRPGDE